MVVLVHILLTLAHSFCVSDVKKAVCYLNNYGEDFEGGVFNFQHGEPKTIAPVSGVSASVYYSHGFSDSVI